MERDGYFLSVKIDVKAEETIIGQADLMLEERSLSKIWPNTETLMLAKLSSLGGSKS